MASKPTVVLTLAGDESKLTDTFAKVGASAKDMASTVGNASKDMQDSGRSMDDLADKAGTGEQRFIGFKDSITGTQDILTGFREGDLLTTAQGFADLAGGLESFVIPAMASFAGFLRGGLASAMSFIVAHPLLITLGLLATAFVVLWTNSETFRNVVMGVFSAVGGFLRSTFGAAIDWLIGAWNGVVGFFAGLPARIGAALGSLATIISSTFKGAVNVLIDALNWGIRRINDLIYGINLINPFNDIPYVPQISRLHTGGTVPGMPGQESLWMLQAGERVIPAGQSGGGGTLRVIVSGGGALAELFHHELRTGGVQLEVDGQPVRVVA